MSTNERQRKYAEARYEGLSITDSAIAAGCPEKSAPQAGSRLEKHPNVIAHIERLKENGGPDDGGEHFDTSMDYLRHVMNSALADPKEKMQAAIALLPYEHQKLAPGGKKDEKSKTAAKVSTGRFSRAQAPLKRVK